MFFLRQIHSPFSLEEPVQTSHLNNYIYLVVPTHLSTPSLSSECSRVSYPLFLITTSTGNVSEGFLAKRQNKTADEAGERPSDVHIVQLNESTPSDFQTGSSYAPTVHTIIKTQAVFFNQGYVRIAADSKFSEHQNDTGVVSD